MEPSIVETTEKAIRILQKNPKGFFLLVEGEDSSFLTLSLNLCDNEVFREVAPTLKIEEEGKTCGQSHY